MNLLDIAIIIFVVFESLNVLILLFAPDSKHGNGVAVFNAWFKAKEHPSSELFARYMASWVAGSKLIFIALLIAVLLVGDEHMKLASAVVVTLSIATYYFRLHPIIKRLDSMGEITPKGYSKILGVMIGGFLLMFSSAIAAFLLF